MADEKLKLYYWKPEKDDESCIAIIAHSQKEAKKIGWHYWGTTFGNDNEWIEIECKLGKAKDYILDGLDNGYIFDDLKEGMKRNVYSYGEGDCEFCGVYGYISNLKDNKLICSNCEDKELKE